MDKYRQWQIYYGEMPETVMGIVQLTCDEDAEMRERQSEGSTGRMVVGWVV